MDFPKLQEFFGKVDDGSASILIIGGGCREHALYQMARRAGLTRIYCAPGNAGIRPAQRIEQADALDFARMVGIDAILVGPEVPLDDGFVDKAVAAGLVAVGPGKDAATLEASKAFTATLCQRFNIRAPLQCVAHDAVRAKTFARDFDLRVVKADGLAAGKGVKVCKTLDETFAAIDGAFGEAGKTVVLQQEMHGPDISSFWLCDGVPRHAKPVGVAYDLKLRYAPGYEGDNPMTGGMGGCALPDDSPLAEAIQEEVRREFVIPILCALEAMTSAVFRGVLYVGLMRDSEGRLRLLEINVRWGDPEGPLVIPRYEPKSLLKNMVATAFHGGLAIAPPLSIIPGREASAGVVLVRREYPGPLPEFPLHQITGIKEALDHGLEVCFGGVGGEEDEYFARGGRVMTVTRFARSVPEAREKLYRYKDHFPHFIGRDYRLDAGEGVE
jgi:phosphoribosylamine--glycine ligase